MEFLALPALLLLPLPLLMRLLPPATFAEGAMVLPEAIAAVARPAPAPGQRFDRLALWLAWICLCLALAGPARIILQPDRSASGRDILLALDMSGSMETGDFSLDGQTVTRLAAVKRVAEGFIRARQGDRLGLVLFADLAYVAAPLTHDLEAVARSLSEAQIGIAGRSTNLSGGLGLAIKRLMAGGARSKAILLLSDGRDTAGLVSLADVARLGAGRDLKIYTVALGPEDLESRPAARDAVDLGALRAIAEGTGGVVFRVRSLEDLQEMAAELDRLEPNPSTRPPVAELRSLRVWPILLGLIFLLLPVFQAFVPKRRGRE